MGTRTTRIRRTNADFNLLDADDGFLKLRYTYRHITPKEKRIRVIRVIRV